MNPLEFPVQLLEVTFDAFVGDPCNETVGTVNEEFYDQPFEFPSKVPVCLVKFLFFHSFILFFLSKLINQ